MINLRCNIKALKPLNVIAKVLGILPNFDEDKLYQHRQAYMHTIFVATLIISISSITTYGNIEYLNEYLEPTAQFLTLATEVSLLLTALVSIIGINICNGKNVSKLLQLLQRIDIDLQHETRNFKKSLRVLLEIVLGFFAFLLYGISDLYTYLTTMEFSKSVFLIWRDLLLCHVIILALILRNYVFVIKYRFETLNTVLAKFDDATAIKLYKSPKNTHCDVKRLQQIFTNLSHATMYYNKIFGWQFITLYAWTAIEILMTINLILVYGTNKKLYFGQTFDTNVIILCGIWAFIPLIKIFAVIYACNACSSEASYTADICYALINNLYGIEDNVAFKDALLEFANQANSRCPQIIAPGGFSVNYSILFTLLSTITTYLIILKQFNT